LDNQKVNLNADQVLSLRGGDVKAKLKSIWSPDIKDLENYSPPENFKVLIEFTIGPENGEGEEYFSLVVWSKNMFDERMGETRFFMETQYLIVDCWDWPLILGIIRSHIGKVNGNNWPEISKRMSMFARSEFED
jgi:hypothetical protein